MAKLSVIIPSRDERFLLPTIHDVFKNSAGEIEIIAVLDSDKWPEGWKEITDQYPNLHTIHNGTSKGMRYSINAGVASAKSRGAKYILKSDAHCSYSEGFDEILKQDHQPNWIVVPRRGRLDPETWTATETHKPDIDYHYLSFPDNPDDFGGPGLNGKPWNERAVERKDILVDEELSSQGSCWFAEIDYFYELELMDAKSYSEFWSEMQEVGLKCWLSGGQLMVNKKCKYLHLHKGRKYGRGYRLSESWLQQGASFTKNWIWNDAWLKQTLPFSWLIEHFWPVPTWPDNWEEVLYATRKPRGIVAPFRKLKDSDMVRVTPDSGGMELHVHPGTLTIHSAYYGVGSGDGESVDVTERLRTLVKNGVLDAVVNNSTLTPDQNPFRGKKKSLRLKYSFDGGEPITVEREEKDWLIIGPVGQSKYVVGTQPVELLGSQVAADFIARRDQSQCPYCGERFTLVENMFPIHGRSRRDELDYVNPPSCRGSGLVLDDGETVAQVDMEPTPVVGIAKSISDLPRTAAALNDYLIRRFSISPQRLRGPMPIELRDFHRNDLAQLFAELGFIYGAEIGVAEGNYSEILMKANPTMKLLCVDPWHAYSDNPQNKSKEKNEHALNEAKRKLKDFHNVEFIVKYSMDAVRDVDDSSLDFVYIDGHHSYPYVMADIIEWTKKVRSGGIIALDDIYKLNEKWGAGPMEAIYDYTRAMRINPWWLIAAHKSVDAFFVKP